MSQPGQKAPPFGLWERAVAWRYLRARKKDAGVALISILAFVGIGLAVFALIVVMSVMNGFRTELLSRILGFNGHVYVAGALPLSDANRDETLRRIRAVPGVTQATAMVEGQAMIVGRGQITGAIVRGVSAADVKATPIVSKNIKAGSLEGYGEGDYGGDMMLLGQRLAMSLGVGPGDAVSVISPSGSSSAFGMSASQKDYTVGGLFSVGMSEYDQAFAYMPLEQAQLFFGKEGGVDVIEVKLADPDTAPEAKAAILKAAGPGASVQDWTEKNQSFFNALQIERNVMRLILMCIVLIAAINIVSSLIMLVKNKGRDIAILRTMGASRSGVLRVFFMAGASIGVAGTTAGLVLGVLFCMNIAAVQKLVESVTGAQVFNADVYFLTHIPARIEWHEVGLIVAWSLFASFVATLPPALRAARLDPVEALRYE
ncbi:MAG: lipoprotein-releasing ABC transporter permease subunit [Caulobacter sp.]|nr:lipoprotein-releasing ABC transporter permease subunit [Caulobacter sp.]